MYRAPEYGTWNLIMDETEGIVDGWSHVCVELGK